MRHTDLPSPYSILGVPGTLKVLIPKTEQLWKQQKWISEERVITFQGEKIRVVAEVRYDDDCGNKHNSFAITGHGWDVGSRYDKSRRDWDFGGCIHEQIAKAFPELEPLIKGHLMSNDSPMHYVANTVYHASNLHNGKAKGEPNSWEERIKFGDFPITFSVAGGFLKWLKAALEHRKTTQKGNPHRKDFQVVEVPYVKTVADNYEFKPKYSFDDFTTVWHQCPFDSKAEALEWQTAILTCGIEVVKIVTGYSKGKERNLDAARRCANWPEATDEQLCLPADELTKLLEARLPAMVAEFKAAIEGAGLLWEPGHE